MPTLTCHKVVWSGDDLEPFGHVVDAVSVGQQHALLRFQTPAQNSKDNARPVHTRQIFHVKHALSLGWSIHTRPIRAKTRFWPELSMACILFQPPEILLLWWEWLASNKKDAGAPFLMTADQGRGCVWSHERNKSTGLKNQFFKNLCFCEKHIHFCTDWESTYGRVWNWQKRTTAWLCRILDMNFGSGIKSACLQTVWREHVNACSVHALVWTCPMAKRQLFLCLSVPMFTRCTGSPSSVCNSNLGL